MPYDSRTFRVLIASPSDVDEEREIAVRVIQEWNDLYSYARKVVLLPLRWETHTAPEYGVRPQEVINRAIVDNCDLVVGIFWTRIGTPTGAADSGTLEEIQRAVKNGKPAMLYFSKVGADPDAIDVQQLSRLNEFKQAVSTNALTESYKSHIDFRDKFAKQLELKVRDLQKDDISGTGPEVILGFATDNPHHLEAPASNRTADIVTVADLDTAITPEDEKIRISVVEEVARRVRRAATIPAVLGISNTGAAGIRNLFAEIVITANRKGVEVLSSPPGRRNNWLTKQSLAWYVDYALDEPEEGFDFLETGLRRVEGGWTVSIEWDALQPQRIRFLQPLYVVVADAVELKVSARVFADSFPEPQLLEATLNVDVTKRTMPFAEIIPDIDKLRKRLDDAGVISTTTFNARR